MNSSIPGLSTAIRSYTSEKLKERSQGLEQIRDIFDSRDNVSRFQETASKEGGAGWVAFFQCLFQVVVMEKKAVLKKAASAQADKRLSDAIGLVRKIAEKTHQLLSKKPFMALFTHMVTLLVHGGQIFPPAAIDYIKALKTILSYPPHLECLDSMNWRIVVGVCWASILGDPVRLSENDEEDELEDESDMDVDRKPDMTQSHSAHARQKTLSNINGEIAGLLPILFSAPAAPLLSPLPEKDTIYIPEPSTGTSMLLKIHRFFQQYPNDNNAHLPVLRTLNLILAEMELNARNEMISASLKLLPQIGALWSTRKKDTREQVVIALRTMLPFVTHKVAGEFDKTGSVRETLAKIMDHLPKEGQLRWGVEPLDLSVVRLKARSRKGKEKETHNPFETSAVKAGFDFSHESALSWVIEELYADICYYLYDTTHATQNLTPSTQASAKRRRIDNAISTLVANVDAGSTASRILHVQILTFFIDRYQDRLHSEAQQDIRRALIDLLDEEDANLQSWAMIAFSHLAIVGDQSIDSAPTSTDGLSGLVARREDTPWNRVWAHATRKIATAALSRAACHIATCLLSCGLANTPKHIIDIRTVLANIEIQGPPYPYDSVCAFLCAAVTIARNDATLYQQKLEDRVMGWLMKWSVVDGAKGRARMDQYSAADIYRLVCEVSGISPLHMSDLKASDVLPDCAIVDRLIEEHNTRPLRRLIIHAEFPDKAEKVTSPATPTSAPSIIMSGTQHSLEGVQGRPGLALSFLTRSIEALSADWPTAEDTALSPPERVRKALDMAVAASAYLVTLQASGTYVEPSCIQAIIHLIGKIRTSLASSSHTIPGQHLMWTAFKPLSTASSHRPATWPILLNASPELSGIRKVLFDQGGDIDMEGGSDSVDYLQKLVWGEPTLGAALKELLPLTESALTGFTGSSATGTSSFQPHQVTEDDFGEIKIAESETMPLSREAIECRRTTSSLMSQLVRYRLCGAMFTSPSGHPGRDLIVINAWLAAEGPRFIQLGLVVCDALQDGLLRLNMSAVDAVLETLEEMVGSYGYSRNEGLLEIALAFLGHSAWVWVSPEASSTDIPERAIILARFLLRKTKRGQIASWRVRLAMILFLDEFLDYDDAATSLWSKFKEDDEMDTEDNDITPFAYMQSALVDIDARVRIRAATSSAAVFLLEDFPAQKHPEFYFDALSRQPGQRDHWDSFMNHLVWKFNCCIASVTIRATVMFHLYEIPPTTPTIHQHFQHGVHAVAKRLHLTSISDLFKPYASIICLSQLESGQKTIMQPFRLYGFPTKAAFGSALLNMVGPSALIESNGFVMFKDACEASSTSITWAFKQHLPAAAALAYIEAVGRGGVSPEIETHVVSTFSKARPHIDDDIPSMITHRIESVFAQLLVLMDLESTSDVVRLQIHTVNTAGSDPETFCTLIPIEEEGSGDGIVALNPCHPSSAILLTHSHLLSQYPSANPAKIVFLAFDMLFRLLHDTFLAAEEKRYLRCLALVVALFPETVREPTILQTFLREIITLLDKTDYPDIVVRILRWGFQQVQPGDDQLHDLPAIMVQLGEVRQQIGTKGKIAAATCLAVDTWLATQVQQWTSQEGFQKTLDFALAFWPKEITAFFHGWTEPSFIDLSSVAETPAAKSFSSMTLCSGLAKGIKTGDRDEFVKNTFWHLRATLSKAGSTADGVSGLLDLLDQVDGDIHAPSLETVVALSQDRTLQRFSDRLAREPATLLRVVLVTKVAELTHHNDYRIRSVAMEVLRKSYQTINDLLARKTVFGTDTATAKSSLPPKPLLELLVPLDPPHALSTATLEALQTDETWVKRSLNPDTWASQLAILLCNVLSTDDVFYSCFIPLLEPQAGCASTMLPWLVQSLLTCGSAKSKLVAESRSSLLSRYFTQIIQWSQASVGTVEIVIWIVLHLRGFAPAFRAGVLSFDHWLEIDPVFLSEAAIKCGAFASALMFLEMKHDDDAQRLDLLDPRVQNIMYEIYSNVEDPDGFYGIQTHDVKSALLRRLQHEKQSWRAFGLNGAAFETGSNHRANGSSAMSMMSNLHDMGFDHLSSGLYKTTSSYQQSETADDPLLLELAWRTGDWDLPGSSEAAQTPHGRFYSCLRAVHRQRDQQAARGLVDVAIRSEIGRLGDLGLERMAQIKDSTANLVCLREISLWLGEDTQKALSEGEGDNKALQRLKSLSDTMDFPVAERVSATRLSLLRAAHSRESKFLIGDLTTPQTETIVALQKSVYLQLGRLARKDGKLQAAVNSITAVQHIEGGAEGSDEANDEFGHVLWDQKEHALAIQHVEQMTKLVGSTTKSNGRLAVLLARNAHWTSVAKMRAPQEIKATFDRAYNMTKASKLGAIEQARVCHEYALFADAHLQALSKSPELDRLRQNRERAHSEFEHIDTLSKSSKSKTPSAKTGESRRQDFIEDERALQDLENELTVFAKTAMKMYASSLIYSDEFDDSVTRLCSMWLEHDDSEDVNRTFSGPVSAIPSHKFIFLGPQLAARLYKPKVPTCFNSALNGLLIRMARDHPFHVLYQVITVAQGADGPQEKSTSKSRRTSDVNSTEGRVPAASELLAILHSDKERPLAREAVDRMMVFTNAAVPWCRYEVDKKASTKVDHVMSKGTPLLALANLRIPPPSVVLPVDFTKKYNHIATIHRYRSRFKVLGGLHRPKRMICVDSLGQEHFELFKGDDELRQDAVMEQVFEMTNRILSRDRKTKARDLRFRRYTVIPLPNRSGVMEFVGDSMAIGEYLKPAHTKYRAEVDHPPDHLRKRLEELQQKDHTSPELTKRYVELMKKFKPVMRHYFTEKHREPMAWFSMRLNYTRSVAVTSIVGHILGIGDRHCSNILIDKLTGELVHIDFGIVFEDGRRLRIPEKVPFRLTNDIVDGLGLTGVDGTFRQCCEHTLRVLRSSSDLILTVLEVFKHDPLYAWAADTEKLKRAQGGGRVEGQSSGAIEKADRVLGKIRQKLRPDLSVEYTVNQLIQEARDPDNLAKIFVGWQPWL